MDKNLIVGLLIGGSALGTAAGIGAYNATPADAAAAQTEIVQQRDLTPQYAEVISTVPVKETYFTEREACRDEVVEVPRSEPVRDQDRIAGTAIGAIIGGIIGNQVGGGSGKKFATAAGAVAGAYAGRKVQGDMQRQEPVETRVETFCQTVREPRERITGYQVSYRIGEETGSVHMSRKPAERLPVVNGEVVSDTQPPEA